MGWVSQVSLYELLSAKRQPLDRKAFYNNSGIVASGGVESATFPMLTPFGIPCQAHRSLVELQPAVILSAAKDLLLDQMQILRRFAPQNDRSRIAAQSNCRTTHRFKDYAALDSKTFIVLFSSPGNEFFCPCNQLVALFPGQCWAVRNFVDYGFPMMVRIATPLHVVARFAS